MSYPYRVGIQQRVLPIYRLGFFDLLAQQFEHGLEVFAGLQKRGEGIAESNELKEASYAQAENFYLPIANSHLLWQKNIVAWIKQWDPDCLVVELNPRNSTTAKGVRWMHKHKRKVMGWGLGTPISGIFSGVKKAYWKKFISQFDALITYSTMGKEQFAALGFDQDRIFVAPNAVAPRPKTSPVNRPMNYKDGQPAVLFVGRMIERKRVDLLLQACAALPDEIKPRLWIAGDGPAKMGWETLAQSVYPQAKFLGGLRGEALEPYWREADLFVLPGTGGLAVQEAMSHSLPVVVGEADGTQADLVRAENSWQLSANSLEVLTAVLKNALSDMKRLRRMGEESYRIVAEEINLESMADAFAKAIATVMELK
jgi:glycosyltransferase involved in cell wall biosynthesis